MNSRVATMSRHPLLLLGLAIVLADRLRMDQAVAGHDSVVDPSQVKAAVGVQMYSGAFLFPILQFISQVCFLSTKIDCFRSELARITEGGSLILFTDKIRILFLRLG